MNAKDLVEILDPRVAEDLEWCRQWYVKHPEEFIASWPIMRPRLIKRLNKIHGVSDD